MMMMIIIDKKVTTGNKLRKENRPGQRESNEFEFSVSLTVRR